MSLEDFDRAPRMADYLTPGDLNTDGCVALASRILADAADEYIQARRAVNRDPTDKNALGHLATCRKFYLSDYFAGLSCGGADGRAVMKELDKLAGRAGEEDKRKWHGTGM